MGQSENEQTGRCQNAKIQPITFTDSVASVSNICVKVGNKESQSSRG